MHDTYTKLPPTDNSSAYTLFSVTSIEGIKYKLQSFNEFEGYAARGYYTNTACCATLMWSGQKDSQVPTTLFSEDSVKSRVGVVLDPTKVDVPHADFMAFNSGGIVREEKIKGSDPNQKFKSNYSKKPGQIRNLRSASWFATNHAKWDAISKEAKPEASIQTFARNVWLKFHGTKKEKHKFDGSSRYGSQGKMPYNEALCYRKKGGENPIDGVFINLTNGDIDDLKQEEVNGVLEILKKNPRLKLYFYDSNSEDNIIRFCNNEKGKEILIKGVAHIKTKSFFQTLTPLTKRQYEETKGAETTDLGQKAREFLQEKNFSSRFGSLTFEQRKNLLLYSWGADSKDPTNNYDNLKSDFKTQNQVHGLTELQLNQIFNDEARKEMIRFVAKESKYEVFLDKYEKKMTELGLPAFLSEEAFTDAKREMIFLIQQDFQEVNLQIQELISCRYGKDNKVLVPSAEECQQVKIYYKQATLTEFQEMLKDTKVLGAKYYDPYSGKIEQFPDNKDDLTIRHLHILARNEHYNTTGKMDESLYCGLLTSDQIAKLRCLVKATNIGTIGKVKSYGGYGDSGEIKQYQPAQDFIIIDQSGLQWQEDLRNSGGLFFYPVNSSGSNLPKDYKAWQDQTYKAMYGKDRGALSLNSEDIIWNGVRGKMDLDKVAEAIKSEFLEALNTAKNQGDSLGEDKKINFRFLKAGFGCFCDGVSRIKGDLELARLKGINSAIQKIAKITDESEQQKYLGKIKSIELPYSEADVSISSSSKDIKINIKINEELKKIEEKLKNLGLEFDCSKKDALSEKAGFITAVTNCGDPHALFGNEGDYESVDAMMSSNMDNPNILNPLINQDMKLVELSDDLTVVKEHHPAPAKPSAPAPTPTPAPTPAPAPTSDPAPTSASLQTTIVGGLIGGALGAGAGFVGANLLITTTSLAMVIPPVGITVVAVGTVGVLGIVAGVHISKAIAKQIDDRSSDRSPK